MFIFLCTDWLTITRTTPHSRSTGWGSRPNSYNVKAVFVAAQSPLGIGDTLSLGYKFRGASSGLLSGHLWGHFGPPWVQPQVTGCDIWPEEPSSQGSWPSRRRIEFIYPSPFREINILELLLSVWSIPNLKVAAGYRPLDYGQFLAVWQAGLYQENI